MNDRSLSTTTYHVSVSLVKTLCAGKFLRMANSLMTILYSKGSGYWLLLPLYSIGSGFISSYTWVGRHIIIIQWPIRKDC